MKKTKIEYPDESIRALRNTRLGVLYEYRIKDGDSVNISYPQLESESAEKFNSFAKKVGLAFFRYAKKHKVSDRQCFILSFHTEVNEHDIHLEWRGYCGEREFFSPRPFAGVKFKLPDFRVEGEILDK